MFSLPIVNFSVTIMIICKGSVREVISEGPYFPHFETSVEIFPPPEFNLIYFSKLSISGFHLFFTFAN